MKKHEESEEVDKIFSKQKLWLEEKEEEILQLIEIIGSIEELKKLNDQFRKKH